MLRARRAGSNELRLGGSRHQESPIRMQQRESTYQSLIHRYGELMTLSDVAEELHYASGAAVRKAHEAGRLRIRLYQIPGRRPLFVRSADVADLIDTAEVRRSKPVGT